MNDAYEYHKGRRADRLYLSRAYTHPGDERVLRNIYKVVDGEQDRFGIVNNELVLRERKPNGRVEVKAVLYEDDRSIQRVTILKYEDDDPDSGQQYTFRGDDLRQFSALLHAIRGVPFEEGEGARFSDDMLMDIANLMSDEGVRAFLRNHPDIAHEVVENDLTQRDIVGLAYRKQQTDRFERLLNEPDFFAEVMAEMGKSRPEDVWQQFFEENTWIFGYGLQYIFASKFETAGRNTLKQMIRGSSIEGRGKEADALLRTLGLISSMCFVEIKRHDTLLLKKVSDAYRADCWQISDELAGAISQIHKVVEITRETIGDDLTVKDSEGFPTGEVAYLFQPKAFILVGSLREFLRQHNVSRSKFGSFELFRRNLSNPEIITFDELYERARHIVEHRSTVSLKSLRSDAVESGGEEDVPF